MNSQSVEPEADEQNDAGQAPAETDATSGMTSLESITWKGYQSAADLTGGDGIRFDRLTQVLASAHPRRRLAGITAAILGVSGWQTGAEAKGRKKKKKKKKRKGGSGATCTPACGDGFACDNGLCACASNVICEESCCASDEDCLETGCCPEGQVCNDACCPDGNSCVRSECCADTRVCNTDCCEAYEVCANIVPGGIKGCCEDTLTIRGETCCPTGSITTRLNCGSYQCKYALSGTGPGGCDLWCKVGAGGEGAGCSRDIEGFPVPGDPDVQCCCGDVARPGVCTYPFRG